MKKIVALLLICVSSLILALPPTPAPVQTEAVVYHNATIHLGNGEVLKEATIAFDKGKITRIGHFRMAWQASDIDLKGKHIYPGFILPITGLGLTEVGAIKATIDVRETGQNNANVRSIVAYNTDSEITPTLKFNGVLLAQPTPQGGLISGLSSVVQLDAWNWQDAAVLIDEGLHVNWPQAMQAKFDFATFTVKMQKNKNYLKQLTEIKSLFENAKAGIKDKDTLNNLKLQAAAAVFTGTRKVYIHSNDAKSIISAVNYFQKIGVKHLVLVTGQGVEPIIGFIKQNEIPVIVTSSHTLPEREDGSVDEGYSIAVKLTKAGVLTALSYPNNMGAMGARNLAFVAGSMAAYGLNKEQALQLITGNTAQILGIDKDYGTLEVGKSATFIITEGDALDMRGNVLDAAYIDGRKLNLDGRQQRLNKRYLEKYGK
jgi:imidazolonepropionase-like amidohydrolase